AVGVVDGDAGVGVGDGGDVRDRTLAAAGVFLEARLGDVRAAAAAAGAPRALGPATGRAGLGQAGAAHGDDVSARSGVLRAVAAVARADGDDDARVVEVLRVRAGSRAVLAAAVAVGDGVGAHRGGRVDGGAQVGHGGAVGLDQEDLAAGAG